MSQALFITGFHRSGTSLTANLLKNGGLYLGAKLMKANASNPYGHFEDHDVVKFHDRLLSNRGLNWQTTRPFIPAMSQRDWRWIQQFATARNKHKFWGFKDPRLCLFTSLWRTALPSAKFLYIYRPMDECVFSLKRRAAVQLFNDRSIKDQLPIWQDLNLAARMYICYANMFLTATQEYGADVAFVSRQAIIDGFDLSGALEKLWGIKLDPTSIEDIYDAGITSSFEPSYHLEPALQKMSHTVSTTIEAKLLERFA